MIFAEGDFSILNLINAVAKDWSVKAEAGWDLQSRPKPIVLSPLAHLGRETVWTG